MENKDKTLADRSYLSHKNNHRVKKRFVEKCVNK